MKSNIGLPPFHIVELTRVSVELDHELTQTLRRYQAFYNEVYGATVSEADLLREMARRFMTSDVDFKSFAQRKRRVRNASSSTAKKSEGVGNQLNFEATVAK